MRDGSLGKATDLWTLISFVFTYSQVPNVFIVSVGIGCQLSLLNFKPSKDYLSEN